jgi:hypothetical protein
MHNFYLLFHSFQSPCNTLQTTSQPTIQLLYSSVTMGNTVSNLVDRAVTAIKNTFRRIAPPIVRYVVEHPLRTLGHISNGILLLVPGVITGPLLAVAGFTGKGIAAGNSWQRAKALGNADRDVGSIAASVQSAMGAIEFCPCIMEC